jgi:hypothetical protein
MASLQLAKQLSDLFIYAAGRQRKDQGEAGISGENLAGKAAVDYNN